MVTAKIIGGESLLIDLGTIGGIISRSKYHIRDICEIRIRAGRPLVLETVRGRAVLDYICTIDEISECVKSFCRYSVHSYERELREGCITLKGGHRAGLCGTAIVRNGIFESIKDISGINIRIAGEITGCAQPLAETVFSENFTGLLIAGRPMCGKTTVLRDLCRIVGNEHKLAIIDSRDEIAAVYGGVPENDVGIHSDVLSGYERSEGMRIAIRTLSPEFIACDELTGDEDSVKSCLSCGVKMIFTVHSGSLSEAKNTLIARSGAISDIAFMGGAAGQITERQAIK